MRYFIDTEFLEGTQNKTFLGINIRKTKPTIDLISIGIISEDNREYYAISKDFNLKEAWSRWQYNVSLISGKNQQGKEYWLRENVLKPIYKELHDKECLYARQALYRANVYIPESKFDFTYRNLKKLITKYGKSNKQIAEDIKDFIQEPLKKSWVANTYSEIISFEDYCKREGLNPEFYAYYADYDWVVFCQLFGKMIDLPSGFPMYCKDLKQILDEKQIWNERTGYYYALEQIKAMSNYPKQTNEHNALADARWNYQLYKFLKETVI